MSKQEDYEVLLQIAKDVVAANPLGAGSSSMVFECIFCHASKFPKNPSDWWTETADHDPECVWIRAHEFLGRSYAPHKVKE